MFWNRRGFQHETNEKGWRCQADLEKRMATWCENNRGNEDVPSESMIRDHIVKAVEKFREGREGL